ncbi:MAG: S9 family peptidase, partial [Flavobacteriaceae bacterium]|nr:S9 family peptidase [Flavobacteriaceae bacterium]
AIVSLQLQLWCCVFGLLPGFCFSQELSASTVKGPINNWSTLYNDALSPDGLWSSYLLDYENGEDTVFVSNLKTNHLYSIPSGQMGNFSKNSKWFHCKVYPSEDVFLNLTNGKIIVIHNVVHYAYADTGDFLAMLLKIKDDSKTKFQVQVIDLHGEKAPVFIEASDFSWRPGTNTITVVENEVNDSSIQNINMDNTTYKEVLLRSMDGKFSEGIWNLNGTAFSCNEQVNVHGTPKMIIHYWDRLQNHYILDISKIDTGIDSLQIADRQVSISQNGDKILFYVQPAGNKGTGMEDETKVQVWKTEDPWIYPRKKIYDPRNVPWKALWYPKTGKVILLGSKEQPQVVYNIEHPYAITYDKLQYEPEYTSFPYVDIYIKNTLNGSSRRILKHQFVGTGNTTISPGGSYICYFRDSNWWIYDIRNPMHINLTKDIKDSFSVTDVIDGGRISPYGIGGWTPDDKEILLYSEFDIWKFSPDGTLSKKITSGKQRGKKYRITWASMGKESVKYDAEFQSKIVNTKEGILLEVIENNSCFGYSYLKKGTIDTIVYQPGLLNQLFWDPEQGVLTYKRQSFDEPPAIITKNLRTGTSRLVVQSNPLLNIKNWGKMEMISYKNENGSPLRAALIYPSHYNPDQKYPMIVDIYEKASNKGYSFQIPSAHPMDGFSPSNYMMDGYFILMPDIEYQKGNPGISAVKCVEAAVKAVLKKNIVNDNRIGLIGHSFGGYEAAFIATQSKLFSAIVAGAPVTDLPSWYFTVGMFEMPTIWRLESYQWRMWNSYYEKPVDYRRNSAVEYAGDINAPVLIWAGINDSNIDYRQSVELYLAMRRLKKHAVMLLYPMEDHVLLNPSNQLDLNNRIHKWFDCYLKN